MKNTKAIEEWLKLSDRTKHNVFEETAKGIGLPNAAAVPMATANAPADAPTDTPTATPTAP